ncbi:MAG: hypothetical protein ACKO28_01520, partial [Cyanobium sp.]
SSIILRLMASPVVYRKLVLFGPGMPALATSLQRTSGWCRRWRGAAGPVGIAGEIQDGTSRGGGIAGPVHGHVGSKHDQLAEGCHQ